MCPAISLIIPVYNVEDYLQKALESIENQTFKNYEVIIIDDGSTDNSVEIIKKFCEKNENFRFIKQANKGPAEARNQGISICKGEYIAFMDSDDYLEPNFLEILYNQAIKNNADISCCNFNMYYPEKDLKICMPFNSFPGIYSNCKALGKLILDIGTHYFVWNKIYKRNLFIENNIKFDNMYFEDISILPRIFYNAKKVSISSDALYNYTMRESSILHSMNATKVNDYIKSLGMLRNFLETKNDYKKYNGYIWIYSQRVKFVSCYNIFNIHKNAQNFKGINKNISCAIKSINYFTSQKFVPCKQDFSIKVPYKITQPRKIETHTHI